MASNRRYKGQIIERCERAPGEHRGRWIIREFDLARGLYYADELCSHHNTIVDAREAIDESHRYTPLCLRCGRQDARIGELSCAECARAISELAS